MKKGYLVLQDGQVFQGTRFGADAAGLGELVFTTGVVGYVETMTDPSYAGQIVLQTYPLIGNVGMIREDFEGPCVLHGYVVREWCDTPSNFRSGETVDDFLRERGIPGLCGVDTRQITRILRDRGSMNAMICDEIPGNLSELQNYRVTGQVEALSHGKKTIHPPASGVKYRAALLDYGAKRNIVRELQRRGIEVIVFPATASAEDVLEEKPDGIVLSNGPGDPAENVYQIAQIRKLLGKAPLMGICLGHQLTALAAGASTYKLKFGHRGANQPVRELRPIFRRRRTGTAWHQEASFLRTWITSQNHGYAVDAASLPTGQVSFVNANDNSCEGVDYPCWNAFTVQFHPEACPGPTDTAFLFDRFVRLMDGCSL